MHIARFRLEFFLADPTIRHAGMACYRPALSEEMAMRASSLLFAGLAAAIISIAPANAQNVQTAQDGKKLQTISEPNMKARWKAVTTYVECKEMVRGMGWSDWEGWYGCNAPWAQKLTHGH
jgi:hypothetical protein